MQETLILNIENVYKTTNYYDKNIKVYLMTNTLDKSLKLLGSVRSNSSDS